jgi:hypothetical protein
MFVYFTSYNSASQINRKQAIQENAVTCNDEAIAMLRVSLLIETYTLKPCR